MNKLLTKYYELLQQAELSTNRKEAIKIIRESTKVREELAEYSGLRRGSLFTIEASLRLTRILYVHQICINNYAAIYGPTTCPKDALDSI